MAKWQRIRATVVMDDPETDCAGVFEAFTDGRTWNGWLVPCFSFEEGKKISEWTKLAAASSVDPDVQDMVRWDAETHAFILESRAYPDEPERNVIDGQYVEELGQILYDIGGFRWTWETASDKLG